MGMSELLRTYKRFALDTNAFIAVFAEEPAG